VVEFLLVAALWTLLAVVSPRFFLTVYLPGYTIGLALCYVHGYFEHWNGTISHYGWMYNWLFFNDGYHVEHHESPGTHWTWLPRGVAPGARTSRWPAILRWLDYCSLDSLERVVLHSRTLQRFVLACHERAFQHLLPDEPITSIAIVGGGLFPRTALILRRLLPDARLVVIDASPENLRSAERHLPSAIECVEGFYDPELHRGFDMVVLPLALVGDRDQYYRTPTAPYMLIHDWLWRPHGQSAIVSCLLMKRLNRISGSEAVPQNFTEQSVRLCRY
jgi:hypothetical protein